MITRTLCPAPAVALLAALALLLTADSLYAGTTGKLSGRVVDAAGEPLPAANVTIAGTKFGSATDPEGYYTIINIPPAKYQVQFSLVGYRSLVTKDIIINIDKTTKLDARLEESVVTTDAVVVTASRPVVEVGLTSSLATITSDDIQTLPVQELQDVVNLQAGVIDGHFRGGRLDEVQWQVNGVSVNNPYDNANSLKLDRSLLQEVQVISGTFDAEYGQAMSGVVNAVLKSGTEKFAWNAEAFIGDYVFDGSGERSTENLFKPTAIQNYQVSLSGPVGLPQTFFILSGRWGQDNGYVYAERVFNPTDSADFEKKVFTPTGDGATVPLGYLREWSGLAKVTNRSLSGIEIGYQAILNSIDSKRADYSWRLNPDGMRLQETFSLTHGLDWTQTLSSSTYYTINARQNLFDYSDYVYSDLYDPRYTDAGGPRTDPAYGDPVEDAGAIIQGVDLGRFIQKTNSFVGKASFTSQISREHLFKTGFEAQFHRVEFGSPGYLVETTVAGVQVLLPRENEPPYYPAPVVRHPTNLAAFAQDQMEWNNLTIRAGLRWEYFDPASTVPSDPANPANSIDNAPQSVPVDATIKQSLAPRLGISYPISEDAAIFFAYGHFYQMPALGQIYTNSDYTILEDLQAGGISYGVMGNPDIKPQRTVQYEFGFKQAVTRWLGVDVNLFYKDIRDLLGVEFIQTYTAAEYARLTNVDFGSVYGFTIALDQRRLGIVSTTLDYTWQMARGNSSDPRETATRASAGEDPRPRTVPLAWDQRHTLNLTVGLSELDNYNASLVLRYGSGQPYTPSVGSGFGAQLETNSGLKEPYVLIDLRGEKYFRFGEFTFSVFARVFNLLDTRAVNGFVFGDTGSPDYSLDPVGDRSTLANPLRYYAPRRIEVGVAVNSLF
jgi:outer membrane receptor protein involved in Fe transport